MRYHHRQHHQHHHHHRHHRHQHHHHHHHHHNLHHQHSRCLSVTCVWLKATMEVQADFWWDLSWARFEGYFRLEWGWFGLAFWGQGTRIFIIAFNTYRFPSAWTSDFVAAEGHFLEPGVILWTSTWYGRW